jgi:hypothetical protein
MSFEEWITQIIKEEKPSEKIKGYFFGIFETENKGYMMYLSGSKEFDEDDENWACNNDFEPQSKYLSLPQYKGLSWEKVLSNVECILTDFVKTEMFKNSFLAKAKGIATGFDDGILYSIYAKTTI